MVRKYSNHSRCFVKAPNYTTSDTEVRIARGRRLMGHHAEKRTGEYIILGGGEKDESGWGIVKGI